MNVRTRRLAIPLAVGLLAAGCVAPPRPTTAPAPEASAAQKVPVAVANLDSCHKVGQHSGSVPASTQRLLDADLACLTAGPAVNPARLSGRPTVVNLWATWCQPCRQEMPILQAAHRRYGAGVQFLGVNTKDRPEWAAEFLQEVDVTYPEVFDPDGRLMRSLRSPGLPVTVVLDAEGRIAGRHVGRISEQQLAGLLSRT